LLGERNEGEAAAGAELHEGTGGNVFSDAVLSQQEHPLEQD
jgi:hypothetical protein